MDEKFGKGENQWVKGGFITILFFFFLRKKLIRESKSYELCGKNLGMNSFGDIRISGKDRDRVYYILR